MMLIKQDGNYYQLKGDKLVGVDITLTGVKEVPGTETKLKDGKQYTMECLKNKLGLIYGKSYQFPDRPVLKEKPAEDKPKTSNRGRKSSVTAKK